MRLKKLKPVSRCADCGHLIPLHRNKCPYCNSDYIAFHRISSEKYRPVEEEIPTIPLDYSSLWKFLKIALCGFVILAVLGAVINAIPWDKFGKSKEIAEKPTIETPKTPQETAVEEVVVGWKGAHQLTGSFYNSSKSWPVAFDLYIQENGDIERATYKNISQNVTIRSMYGHYDDNEGSLVLNDSNGNLTLQLTRDASGIFNGYATSGNTTLNVTLSENAVENAVEEVEMPAETVSDYNFDGNITYKSNIYYFQMNLHVEGNRVNGDYIVTNGENVRVDLAGTVDDNGNALIREYKNGVSTNYYFQGYLSEDSFSGKYKCSNRPIVMDFSAVSY